MDRHELAGNRSLMLRVRDRAAHDWADGVDHSAGYARYDWLVEAYRNEQRKLSEAYGHAANDNYAAAA